MKLSKKIECDMIESTTNPPDVLFSDLINTVPQGAQVIWNWISYIIKSFWKVNAI